MLMPWQFQAQYVFCVWNNDDRDDEIFIKVLMFVGTFT